MRPAFYPTGGAKLGRFLPNRQMRRWGTPSTRHGEEICERAGLLPTAGGYVRKGVPSARLAAGVPLRGAVVVSEIYCYESLYPPCQFTKSPF